MASVIGVLALAVVALGLEIPGLLHRKRKWELVVFLVLLFTGTAIYIALVLDAPLPNLLQLVKINFS
ncbi:MULTISPECIES: hypothetical protein [Paenibacillus]|uniref:Uncharacterized protein n=1 Tax=Paenibacillus agri TaxID=2744309 RepID=A0A850ENQ7_9BACL|nr:hypothetical protein [Paenibacillus agri]NUU62625.1 hypothetical protein [Paenibacillus agri]